MKVVYFVILLFTIGCILMIRDMFFSGRSLGLEARCLADIANINTIIVNKLAKEKLKVSEISAEVSPISVILPEFANVSKDPWGHFYQIQRIDQLSSRYKIYSLGKDGFLSKDDIVQIYGNGKRGKGVRR